MSSKEFEKQLDESLQNLPNEIQPSRDLWRGINQAINQQGLSAKPVTERKFNILVGSMVMACTILVAVFFVYPRTNSQLGLSEPVRLMVENFHSEKRASLKGYQSIPVVFESMGQRLDELSAAEKIIIKALEHDPDNPALIRMLAHVYKQQLELIKKAHHTRELSI